MSSLFLDVLRNLALVRHHFLRDLSVLDLLVNHLDFGLEDAHRLFNVALFEKQLFEVGISLKLALEDVVVTLFTAG